MHIIYLAGNSIRNKDWIEEVKRRFDAFSTGQILYYDHWESGAKMIGWGKETKKLAKLVEKQKDYCVFAKSVGTILTLKAISEGLFEPKKIIFCGFPCSFVKGNNFGLDVGEILLKLSIPTIFVHNEFDKVGGEQKVKKILVKYPPKDYKMVINPGIGTHDYDNYRQLVNLAKEFFIK